MTIDEIAQIASNFPQSKLNLNIICETQPSFDQANALSEWYARRVTQNLSSLINSKKNGAGLGCNRDFIGHEAAVLDAKHLAAHSNAGTNTRALSLGEGLQPAPCSREDSLRNRNLHEQSTKLLAPQYGACRLHRPQHEAGAVLVIRNGFLFGHLREVRTLPQHGNMSLYKVSPGDCFSIGNEKSFAERALVLDGKEDGVDQSIDIRRIACTPTAVDQSDTAFSKCRNQSG